MRKTNNKIESVEEFLARGGKITVLPEESILFAKSKIDDETWFDDLDIAEDDVEEQLEIELVEDDTEEVLL